jgi:SAM-dependent methyltransferase
MTVNWSERYQRGDTPWDKGRHHPALEWLVRERRPRGRILVPGCGRGHDAAFLAGSGAVVSGFDLAPEAIAGAKATYPGENPRFDCLDLKKPALFKKGCFDWIVEHTCLCALDPEDRRHYPLFAAHGLKPGGTLFAVVFDRLDSEDGPPFATPATEMQSLFGEGFSLEDLGPPPGSFPGRENEERMWLLRRMPDRG